MCHGHHEGEFIRTDDEWNTSSLMAKRRITREVAADVTREGVR
ncbi:MAG: hypothetical protein ACQET5_06930 [Halobacteriota archaeon]